MRRLFWAISDIGYQLQIDLYAYEDSGVSNHGLSSSSPSSCLQQQRLQLIVLTSLKDLNCIPNQLHWSYLCDLCLQGSLCCVLLELTLQILER